MSEVSQGEGWRQAPDGKWFPPCEVAPMPPYQPNNAKYGVDFIDILFGLVVTEIFAAFTGVTLHEYATWANLILALIIVVFSWIGYHVAKNTSPRTPSFDPLVVTQLFVDVVIVAIYLAFVKQIEHTEKVAQSTHHIISIRPEAVTIVVIFALYTLWDILQVPLMKGVGKEQTAKSHRARGLWAFVAFAVFSAIVIFAWRPGSNAPVIVADLIFVAMLYWYRWLQARAK